jgi:hypothetical protein
MKKVIKAGANVIAFPFRMFGKLLIPNPKQQGPKGKNPGKQILQVRGGHK